MKYIADLHIHSKYSRACSKELVPEKIAWWCARKGIDIVSTADFTHPLWFKELQEKLEPAEKGLYKLKDLFIKRDAFCQRNKRDASRRPLRTNSCVSTKHDERFVGTAERLSAVRFLVSTEISCIYKRGGKTRRVHLCIFMPSLEDAEKFNKILEAQGRNLSSDGRPILGLDSEEILKIILDINPDSMLVPAHAWTPWFAVFGSMSGFDSLEECFGDNAKHIYAIETGLSSDPPMNWSLSQLDNIVLLSNSDAHSLEKLGREANVFSFESPPSYFDIMDAIKNKDRDKFLETLEFFPEEGKYHMDGHRDCKVCLTPEETKRANYICPVCKKPLTIGVMNRVSQLADREVDATHSSPLYPREKSRPTRSSLLYPRGRLGGGSLSSPPLEKGDTGGFNNKIPYKSIVPLQEIIAECFGNGWKAKRVVAMYDKLLEECGTEFEVLLDVPIEEIKKCGGEIVGEAIDRMRQGNIFIQPGYDGEFGIVKIFNPEEREEMKQKALI